VNQEKQPPKNAQRIYRVAELPPFRGPETFIIHEGDELREVTLSKRQRQVLELLMCAPVYCASPVRISDMVFVLREEVGLDIETRMFPGDPETGAGSYGVYFLNSRVERADQREVA
jgi:hypothetical protein